MVQPSSLAYKKYHQHRRNKLFSYRVNKNSVFQLFPHPEKNEKSKGPTSTTLLAQNLNTFEY